LTPTVKDVKKLLGTFSGGLHHVLAYGNYAESIEEFCKLLDIKVVSEIN